MKVTKIDIRDILSYAGPDLTVLGGLGRVNVIVGKNDAGKSNLLKVVKWARDAVQLPDDKKQNYPLAQNWRYISAKQSVIENEMLKQPHISVSFRIEIADWPKGIIPDWLIKATTCKRGATLTVSLSGERNAFRVIEDFEWDLDSELMNLFAMNQADAREMTNRLLPDARKIVASKVVLLDARRNLSTPVFGEKNYVEFVDSLLESEENADEAGKLYQQIVDLFGMFIGESKIELHRRRSLQPDFNVKIRDRIIPLSQHGDGYCEMFMIAVNFVMHPDAVLLIEEPEKHLHADSQRRLLWHCADVMTSQLFITTHSSVLLDVRKADCILHITHDGRKSKINRMDSTAQHYATLDDIGARASDILQANVVVWVEGPSDAILIEHALSVVDKDIQKGLHYVIVFYGGALRKYCHIAENSNRLVNLLSLGRRTVMVCDRDGKDSSVLLNSEKRRLGEACVDKGGISWITKGREIENYLRNAVLSKAFRELLNVPDLQIRLGKNQKLADALQLFEHKVKRGRKKWLRYDTNKPEIMSIIVRHITKRADLNQHDFLQQIDTIAEFIRKNNALPDKKLNHLTAGHPNRAEVKHG